MDGATLRQGVRLFEHSRLPRWTEAKPPEPADKIATAMPTSESDLLCPVGLLAHLD